MNDKTELNELKSFFDRLQFEDNGDNMYDDEYDDTYDGLGGDPIDARDEETTVTKCVPRGGHLGGTKGTECTSQRVGKN
jgi:hypothetical protein